MPQYINTNIASINTVRILDKSQASLQMSMERLASGKRINHARDDAAGMAISEGMTSQIRGMNQAVRNTNDGVSMVQTADGALGGIADKLQRIRELGVQSMNGTYSVTDRTALDKEVQGLLSEIERVATSVKFNGTTLLNSSSTINIQVGDKTDSTQQISINLQDASRSGLSLTDGEFAGTLSAMATGTAIATFNINGVAIDAIASTASGGSGYEKSLKVRDNINAKTSLSGVSASINSVGNVKITSNAAISLSATVAGLTSIASATTTGVTNVKTVSAATTLVLAIDTALGTVNTARATLGASQNRLETTVQDLKNNVENLSGARSRIQDADFAEETATLAKNQILQQAGMAMLAQANQLPQNVLSLLR